MRPLIFDYCKEQGADSFPDIKYNNKLNLNTLNDKIFIDCDNIVTVSLTKTKTVRETDDESFGESSIALRTLTKTASQREADDAMCSNVNLLHLLTKTRQQREQDE